MSTTAESFWEESFEINLLPGVVKREDLHPPPRFNHTLSVCCGYSNSDTNCGNLQRSYGDFLIRLRALTPLQVHGTAADNLGCPSLCLPVGVWSGAAYRAGHDSSFRPILTSDMTLWFSHHEKKCSQISCFGNLSKVISQLVRLLMTGKRQMQN